MSRPLVTAYAAAAALVLGGCAAGTPGESVPSLADGVADVDAAVAAGDDAAARDALEQLVADAGQAVDEGRLSPTDGETIVAAAEALLAELTPEPAPEPEPEPTEDPEPAEPEKPEKPGKGPKPEKPGKPDKHDDGDDEESEEETDEDD